MSRIVVPARTRLVYVESRGWLLGKLGMKVLVIAGVIFVWGPLVAGRPQAMRLVGWLAWAATAPRPRGRRSSRGSGLGCRQYGIRARPFVGGGRSAAGVGYGT